MGFVQAESLICPSLTGVSPVGPWLYPERENAKTFQIADPLQIVMKYVRLLHIALYLLLSHCITTYVIENKQLKQICITKCPKKFQSVPNLCRVLRNFSRLSRNFSSVWKLFHIVWNLSRVSGDFLMRVWTFSRVTNIFLEVTDTFQSF